MDNKSIKRPSLFDNILNEINNKQQSQCGISNDRKSMSEICKSDEINSTVNINIQHDNLNEYNSYNDMVR